MADILYDPLGQDDGPSPPPKAGWARIVVGVLVLAGLAVGGAVLIETRHGTEAPPVAAVAIVEKQKPPEPAPSPVVEAAAAKPIPSGTLSAADVDRNSGVTVTRPNGTGAADAMIIKVPQDLGVTLQRAPDPRLVEKSRYGLLPRRGSDGSKPLDVYARPALLDAALPANAPRIAIVVGGMGLNSAATSAAVSALPPAVTLAFAPYGDVLDVQVQAARDAGHEAILQVPMEAPGDAGTLAHRLMTGLDAKETLDRLHWNMGRFTGYVGVGNYLGATFTADADAFGPVLGDVANRGLLYFDDGTTSRSLAATLAPMHALPLVRADTVIDAVNEPAAIDAALKALERQARSRGTAIGFASGRPEALAAIVKFTKGLEGRGIGLVPASALAVVGNVQGASNTQP